MADTFLRFSAGFVSDFGFISAVLGTAFLIDLPAIFFAATFFVAFLATTLAAVFLATGFLAAVLLGAAFFTMLLLVVAFLAAGVTFFIVVPTFFAIFFFLISDQLVHDHFHYHCNWVSFQCLLTGLIAIRNGVYQVFLSLYSSIQANILAISTVESTRSPFSNTNFNHEIFANKSTDKALEVFTAIQVGKPAKLLPLPVLKNKT